MAEFGENASLSPSNPDDTFVPSDEATGKTHCEVSVLNGDCGISANMVGSGALATPGSQAELETANTSVVGLDAKAGIPRRSSIIKVTLKNKVALYAYLIYLHATGIQSVMCSCHIQ